MLYINSFFCRIWQNYYLKGQILNIFKCPRFYDKIIRFIKLNFSINMLYLEVKNKGTRTFGPCECGYNN